MYIQAKKAITQTGYYEAIQTKISKSKEVTTIFKTIRK
jgi:hypothetical protein